jgi:hypothetical protein
MEERNIFEREGARESQISTTTVTSKTNIPTHSDPHPHQLNISSFQSISFIRSVEPFQANGHYWT